MSSRIWKWILAVSIVSLLYFFRIGGVGVLGPDEPRYASIGREMARSGDWITPRLWGEPWFEKPALLYWMIGLAQRLGLGDDLSPRVPVAMLSVLFLGSFYFLLRRFFGTHAAFFAAAMLATSAGWVAFSHVGATDLPLAVFFSLSLLLAAEWLRKGDLRWAAGAGLALGFAVLAKGLVPIVLAAPIAWQGRKHFRHLMVFGGCAVLAAAPWYIAVTARFGRAFVDDFFWRHHFQRFASDVLQHQQPVWFYLPVLAGALFPWAPVLALLANSSLYRNAAVRLFLLSAAWGFLFFSLSTNKLPGYLLPLLPAICAVGGVALAGSSKWRVAVVASALLLVLLPTIVQILPQALASGLSKASLDLRSAALSAIPLVLLALVVARLSKGAAVALVAAAAAFGVVYLKLAVYPALEESASARPLWSEIASRRQNVCVDSLHRNWRYGLNYYSVQPLPDCTEAGREFEVVQQPGRHPVVRQMPATTSLP